MMKHYYSQQSWDDALNAYETDDDEHLVQFENLLFNELLCNVKEVPFDGIINTELIYDGAKVYHTIQTTINSLDWLYTADRLNTNGKTIYSFRFASPCHPDYYNSFITAYHPCFELSNQTRHGLKGWYKYIGTELPKMVENYLKIAKVMNEKKSYGPAIFVNNQNERLDIEFYLQSGNSSERITITFEPGYPAVS